MRRSIGHLLSPAWRMRRLFGPDVLGQIETAIRSAERHHAGELRFVVEHALEPWELWHGLSARDRALQLFGLLRVWDTEANNGILIYLLLAERAVEIVADRGIAHRVPQAEWDALCRELESEFRKGRYAQGSVRAVEGAAALLSRHFAPVGPHPNELPDQPLLL